jgi:Phosphatidylserine decarboxylase
MRPKRHQYVERETSRVRTEKLMCDGALNFIYSNVRENAPVLFRAVTSARMTELLSFLNYDLALGLRITGAGKFIEASGIDLSECLDHPRSLNTLRKIFGRKIRYWETRPISANPAVIVSPADSKAIFGSFSDTSGLFLKEKFFDFEELLGADRKVWLNAFEGGGFAVFRLTPDKYHYNHAPVAGRVVDIYEITGRYHSCNPGAAVAIAAPYSKNKRVVTIIDTDVDGGTKAGLVAMVEIVALMIGDIVQCYSAVRYDFPQEITRGMFLRKGQPKSLYRPGSSTDLLIFQKEKVRFADDLVANMRRQDVKSRFSEKFRMPLAETDIRVRSQIAMAGGRDDR